MLQCEVEDIIANSEEHRSVQLVDNRPTLLDTNQHNMKDVLMRINDSLKLPEIADCNTAQLSSKKDLVMNAADETEAMQNANQLRRGENFTPTASEPCSNDKKVSESDDQIIQDAIAGQKKLMNLIQTRNMKTNCNILSKLNR